MSAGAHYGKSKGLVKSVRKEEVRLRIVKVGRKHRLLNKARWERQAGEKREELYLAGRTRVPIARAGE